MFQNKAVSKAVSIYLLAGLIIVTGINVLAFFLNSQFVAVLCYCAGLFCCTMTALYGLRGYRKNAAPYYKLFMLALFLNYQISICYIAMNLLGLETGIAAALQCLCAACALVLMLAHDLGKELSLTLCGMILVVSVAQFAGSVVMCPGALLGGDVLGTVQTLRTGANCFLAQVALVMTMAKYQDKTARGTK